MMTIGDKIRDEKLQYDINTDAARISALSSERLWILPSNQRQTTEQTKFAYSPLGNTFEKQTDKKVAAIKSLKP